MTKPLPNDASAERSAPCATREVLDRIGDAWSVMVILNLRESACRFSQLKRQVGGITQRMLTVTLRHLERDGLVSRRVFDASPPHVEYSLTPRGRSLSEVLIYVSAWAIENGPHIREDRITYDTRKESAAIAS